MVKYNLLHASFCNYNYVNLYNCFAAQFQLLPLHIWTYYCFTRKQIQYTDNLLICNGNTHKAQVLQISECVQLETHIAVKRYNQLQS